MLRLEAVVTREVFGMVGHEVTNLTFALRDTGQLVLFANAKGAVMDKLIRMTQATPRRYQAQESKWVETVLDLYPTGECPENELGLYPGLDAVVQISITEWKR